MQRDLVPLHEFYGILRNAVERAGSQTAFAQLHGLSVGYVNDVLHTRRDPGDAILSALGLCRVLMFAPIKGRVEA